MLLWRKSADARWSARNTEAFETRFSGRLALIERPGKRRTTIEVCCRDRAEATSLCREFGGTIASFPRDLVKAFARHSATNPVAIGRRLVVQSENASPRRARNSPAVLVIPAEAAFGTGAHATTAMTLRLLERTTRDWPSGWSLLDVGTGSGILALAARAFGAREIRAVDNDPIAVATARRNARRNRIRGVCFETGDATKISSRPVDVITANLYSELLMAALPNLRRALSRRGYLILSGVLRTQENDLQNALQRGQFTVKETRRRGKWIALLAHRR